MSSGTRTRGVTLVELLVALTILGVLTGLTTFTWAGNRLGAEASSLDTLRVLRDRALRTGRASRATITTATGTLWLMAYPDGRVLTSDSALVNSLSGRASSAAPH